MLDLNRLREIEERINEIDHIIEQAYARCETYNDSYCYLADYVNESEFLIESVVNQALGLITSQGQVIEIDELDDLPF